MDDFEKELESLLNKNCKEDESDTPDFILSRYLLGCLEAWNKAVISMEKWYMEEQLIIGDKKITVKTLHKKLEKLEEEGFGDCPLTLKMLNF